MPNFSRFLMRPAQQIALPLFAAALFFPGFSQAEAAPKTIHLADVLPKLMTVDHGILAAQYDADSKKLGIWETKTDWLPSLSYDGKYGSDRIIKDPDSDTNYAQNEEDFKLKQLIYDFGKTGSAISTAELSYKQSLVSLLAARQSAMIDGEKAYLDVYKAYKSLEFAKRNEKNVSEQVKMEQVRHTTGSGFQTDVLEAQAQLSGAKAKVTQAEGALAKALNAYKRKFLEDAKHPEAFVLPAVPEKLLPRTVEEVVKLALENNTDVLSQKYTVDIAHETIRDKRAAFAPSLDALGEAKFQWDMNGVKGKKQEYLAELQISYPFFDSFGDVAAYKASKLSLSAAEERLYTQQTTAEESVRNDWEAFLTARANAVYLDKQAQQLETFLRLATKERTMGRKTLLEVLVADTNYVNALDQAVAAEVEVNKSAYNLLKDMGLLNMTVFTQTRLAGGIDRVKQMARTKEAVRVPAAYDRKRGVSAGSTHEWQGYPNRQQLPAVPSSAPAATSSSSAKTQVILQQQRAVTQPRQAAAPTTQYRTPTQSGLPRRQSSVTPDRRFQQSSPVRTKPAISLPDAYSGSARPAESQGILREQQHYVAPSSKTESAAGSSQKMTEPAPVEHKTGGMAF